MRYCTTILSVLVLAFTAMPSSADPVFGSTESFPGVTTGDWIPGQAASISNPGTGGVGGAADGYILLTQAITFNYGMRNEGPLYAGDWVTPGITHLSLWLNDVGTDDDFTMHVVIGNAGNRWQYNVGFVPPNGSWERFVVDFSDEASFTQIIGSETFSSARLTADRIQVRHDLAPYMQQPDDTSGDLGIDEIVIGDLMTPTRETSWGRLKSLYR